jgi:hypothetical protein
MDSPTEKLLHAGAIITTLRQQLAQLENDYAFTDGLLYHYQRDYETLLVMKLTKRKRTGTKRKALVSFDC